MNIIAREELTVNELATELVRGLQATLTLVNQIAGSTQDAAVDNAKIVLKIETLEKEVGNLLKIVRDGNGQPALVLRVDKLESLTAAIKEAAEQHRANSDVMAQERSRGRWAVAAAFTTGFLALAASIIAIIIQSNSK